VKSTEDSSETAAEKTDTDVQSNFTETESAPGSDEFIQFDLDGEEDVVVQEERTIPKPEMESMPLSSSENGDLSFDLPEEDSLFLENEKDDGLPVKELPEVEDKQSAEKSSEKIHTISLAKVYLNQGYYERAEEIILDILKNEPENDQAKAILLEIREIQNDGADKQTVENVSDAPWKETIDENAQKKILTTFQNTLDAIMLVKKERGNQVQ